MGRKVKLDFSNVQSYKKCAEGIHTAKLVQIDEGTTQGGDDMLKAVFEVTKGDSKGARVFDNFALTDKALWKFKICLSAMGIKTDGKIAVDLDKLVGKLVDIEVAHEEYNGQVRARITDYSAVEDTDDEFEDDDDIEDEAPAEKPAKKKAEPDDDEDDEDWEDA